MKKVIFLLWFLLGFFSKSQAQIKTPKNFIQEFELGLHVTPFIVFNFKNDEEYFLGNASLDVAVCGPKSHHHVGYEFISNSVEVLNGVFLNDTWDIYCYFSKNLGSKDFLCSVGVEKYYEGDFLNKIVFLDFGTGDFKYYSGTVGIIFEVPLITWKRE